LRSLVLLLALGSAAIAATVLFGVANTADSFGFISTAAVMTASVAINTVFALVLGMLAFLYLIAASLVLCVEINVVRVDRLHPRALLSPFTDNVELTDGDRKTYTGRAKAQRAKGFQCVEVSFDQRESQQRRAADTPRPTTAHGQIASDKPGRLAIRRPGGRHATASVRSVLWQANVNVVSVIFERAQRRS